jgi:hypothetical protein
MKRAFLAVALVALLSSCDSLVEEREPTRDCVTGKWWVGGDTGHELMHPGRDCVGCHRENDGPPLALGGTVYPLDTTPDHQANDCFGKEGIIVRVTDAKGRVFEMTTNEAGNFYLEGDESRVAKPYSAELANAFLPNSTTTIKMAATKPLTGDCNFCHLDGSTPVMAVSGVRFPWNRIDTKDPAANYPVLSTGGSGGMGGTASTGGTSGAGGTSGGAGTGGSMSTGGSSGSGGQTNAGGSGG